MAIDFLGKTLATEEMLKRVAEFSTAMFWRMAVNAEQFRFSEVLVQLSFIVKKNRRRHEASCQSFMMHDEDIRMDL